jgi:hypothetical protein
LCGEKKRRKKEKKIVLGRRRGSATSTAYNTERESEKFSERQRGLEGGEVSGVLS